MSEPSWALVECYLCPLKNLCDTQLLHRSADASFRHAHGLDVQPLDLTTLEIATANCPLKKVLPR